MSAFDIQLITDMLQRPPRTIDAAVASPSEGGLPETHGFYAWWVVTGALDAVPPRPHPTEPNWSLLYIGIGPARASSKQTLRSRVIGNHLGGNIGSSTFRLTLAALLRDQLALHPVKRATKVVLSCGDNAALSRWQRAHLRITWLEHAAPWTIEHAVINALEPPLNLDGNASHPSYGLVKAARAALRQAAA